MICNPRGGNRHHLGQTRWDLSTAWLACSGQENQCFGFVYFSLFIFTFICVCNMYQTRRIFVMPASRLVGLFGARRSVFFGRWLVFQGVYITLHLHGRMCVENVYDTYRARGCSSLHIIRTVNEKSAKRISGSFSHSSYTFSLSPCRM